MKKLKDLSRNSKNAELLDCPEIATALESGEPVVFAITPTSNDDYVQIDIVQSLSAGDEDDAKAKANAFFLGWNGLLVRGWQSIDTRLVENSPALAAAMKRGAILKGMNISINDSIKPFYEGQKPKSRMVDGERYISVTKEGHPVYRETELVIGTAKINIISNTKSVHIDDIEMPFAAFAGKLRDEEESEEEEKEFTKIGKK